MDYYYYDDSDILTPRARATPRPSEPPSLAPRPNILFRLTSLAVFGLIAYFAFLHLKVYFIGWQERTYKLSMRRRYGIPDDDHRPFNVAFAAARHARLGQPSDESTPEVRRRSLENFVPMRSDSLDGNGFRQRFNGIDRMSTPRLQSNQNLAAGRTIQDNNTLANDAARNAHVPRPPVRGQPVLFEDTMKSALLLPGGLPIPTEPDTHAVSGHKSQPAEAKVSRKRGLDDESNVEVSKRTRMSGKEIIDVDAVGNDRMDEDLPQKRGSKRGPSPDEDEGYSSRQEGREKRIRRVSRENTDEVMDTDNVPRGKKRDRGEAGSTFGGDDDYLDIEDLTSSRRRRRRMERKRSDQSLHGAVIDFVMDSSDEDDGLVASGSTQSEDNKKEGVAPHEKVSVVDDAPISIDPLCNGRKIGEEWEEDDEHYKVGPNGQRLRQALVKKSRTKFPAMPADSNHIDRAASWDIFVEKWLTDEEFEAAKEKFELAWQETPATAPRSSEDDVPASPGKKSLLWASRLSEKDNHITPKLADPLSTQPTPATNNNGARANPFAKSRLGVPGRRIASPYASATFHIPPTQATSTPSTDSPTKTTLSKWEKQEFEAQAMNRMRKESQELQEEEARKAVAKLPAVTATTSQGPGGGSSFFTLPKPEDKPATPAASALSGEAMKTPESAKAPPTSSFFSLPPVSTAPASTPAPASTSIPAPTTASAPAASTPSAPASSSSLPSADVNMTSVFSWPTTPTSVADKDKAPVQSAASTTAPGASSFFAAPPKPTQPQSTAASGSQPDFFNIKGASTAPTANLSTPQSNNTTHLAASTAPAGASSMTPSFFAPPTASAAPATPSPSPWGTGATANPTSSSLFGAVTEQKKPEEKKPEQASFAGGSLLSRLGGFSQPNTTSVFGPTSTSSNTGSIFGNPAAQPEAAKTTSVFGAAPSPNTTNTSVFGPSSTSTSSEAPKPKFKFDIPSRSSGSSSAPATSDAQKSAGATTTSGGPIIASAGPNIFANTGSMPGSTGTPKFNFPTSSSAGSGGDIPMSMGSSGDTPMSTDMPNNATKPSIFAGSSAPSAPPATSVFGSTGFGNAAGSANKPAEKPKLSFNFPPTPQLSSQIFGKSAASAPKPAQGSALASFSFPTPSNSNEAAKSVFGPPSGPGASTPGAGGLSAPAPAQTQFKFTFGAGSGSQPTNNSAAPSTTNSAFGNPTPSQNTPAAPSQGTFSFPTSSTSNIFEWPKSGQNQK